MDGAWTSTLSVNEFSVIREVGFDAVGQVMGSTVDYLGYDGSGYCGYTGNPSDIRTIVTGTASARSPWFGFGPRAAALYAARRRALSRLERECRAVGGDGVVATQLTIAPYPGATGTLEFTAIGTAVRSRGGTRPSRPFTSALSGQDFARLITHGWVPCGMAFSVAIGVRHIDLPTRNIVRGWTNAELSAHTDLVHAVRTQAAVELRADIARQGGEGCVLRATTLNIRDAEGCDQRAEASMSGTAIVRFRRGATQVPPTLQVLHLDQAHHRVVSKHLTDRPGETR